jgi:hemoglobin-like flavoprotein
MTSAQQQLLFDSWLELEPHADRAAMLFFDRLCVLDARCHALFDRDGHGDRTQTFRRMMAEVVGLHDDPREFVMRAAELGRRHAEYGVRETDYRSVHDAMLWALERTCPSLGAAGVRAAWNEAFAFVATIMRRAGSGAAPVDR